MKIFTKGKLILLAGVVLSYSACQKDSSAPVQQAQTKTTTTTKTNETVAAATVAGQVGVNLTQSLSGAMGGTSIAEGLTPKALSGASSLCGFVADSNIHYTTNIGDTIKSTSIGASQFYFDCIAGHAIGYTLTGELATKGTAPGYGFTYLIVQGYAIKSLNSTDTQFSVVGALKAFKDFTYTNPAYKPASEHDSFVLTDCVTQISSKGVISILSGTATFTTIGYNASGSWDYVGTLTFLGNNEGKMAFEGHVFLINLVTGQSTLIS